MAATAVTRVNVSVNEATSNISASSIDTTDGALIEFGGKDIRTLLILNTAASGGATITIKGGNGAKGIPDMTISLSQNDTKAIWIDSAYFMQVSGTNKGKVLVTTSAAANVRAITVA